MTGESSINNRSRSNSRVREPMTPRNDPELEAQKAECSKLQVELEQTRQELDRQRSMLAESQNRCDRLQVQLQQQQQLRPSSPTSAESEPVLPVVHVDSPRSSELDITRSKLAHQTQLINTLTQQLTEVLAVCDKQRKQNKDAQSQIALLQQQVQQLESSQLLNSTASRTPSRTTPPRIIPSPAQSPIVHLSQTLDSPAPGAKRAATISLPTQAASPAASASLSPAESLLRSRSNTHTQRVLVPQPNRARPVTGTASNRTPTRTAAPASATTPTRRLQPSTSTLALSGPLSSR